MNLIMRFVRSALVAGTILGSAPSASAEEILEGCTRPASSPSEMQARVAACRKAAEEGHAKAQHDLAIYYARGEGVPQDHRAAAAWYRRAADQGHVMAQYYLARAYQNGEGVEQNYAKAAEWYRLAAEQGSALAEFELGFLYFVGKGVPEDNTKAAAWVRRAAAPPDSVEGSEWGRFMRPPLGDQEAQYYLGLMYGQGLGVSQDYRWAVFWYRRSAEQGYAPAQKLLGLMYFGGRGIPQDYVLAHKWCNLAAARGDSEARECRDEVQEMMSQVQVREAQRLAREWNPKWN